ncbi:MAG: hypothetical protein ACXVBW_15215, partial [Bdellovibrionota bacterium]
KNRLGVYQKRNLQRTNVQQIEQAQAQKAVVCSQYGMANTINCVHSLDTMLAMMSPRDNGDTLVELMIEVFTDPRYVEPARLAAKKVLARVRRDLPEREGDLFGDILAAFVESGVPTPEAEEMAWKFLAMTQVHGVDSPMFLRDLTTKANSPILIATAVIGAGEYILDGRRVKSGHLYSYPPNVRSHCDFGKAYHFWIAAYLSRALAKSSGNGDAAAAAAWITHLGYQMRGSFGSRDPRRPFTEDVYGVTNNGVRMDLAYAAAGARFGVQSAAGISKGLDIDEALRELLRHADPTLAPMSKSEAGDQYSGTGISGYRRFHQLFAPDKAFESFPR